MGNEHRSNRLKWIIFTFLFLSSSVVIAKEIPSPPPLKEEPVEEQAYLQTLYDNWNNLEETLVNPNGNRIGSLGDVLLYKTTFLRYYITVNIDGAYHWWAVEITNIL